MTHSRDQCDWSTSSGLNYGKPKNVFNPQSNYFHHDWGVVLLYAHQCFEKVVSDMLI